MSYFEFEGNITTGVLSNPLTAGRLDFGVNPDSGQVVVTNNATGHRVTLTLREGRLPTVSAQSYPNNLGDTTSAVLDDRIVTLGDDDIAVVASMGESDSQTLYANRSGEAEDRIEAIAVQNGADTLIYMSATEDDGISAYKLEANGSLTLLEHKADNNSIFTQGVTAMAQVTVGGTTYVFAASAVEDGISAYRVKQSGTLAQSSQIEASPDFPINDPQALEPVMVNGTQYMIVAASGSSSLTVVEITADGQMIPVDMIIDDLGTRFANTTVLESFVVDDYTFVLAGGSDDGLSLFTVLPDGRLLHLETLVDTAQVSLANITDISVQVVNGEVQLFVASGIEGGISQFIFDPGDLGDLVITGTNLTGTSRNDILRGGSGANVITGGGGDDILMDGAGSDTLVGGAGADIFVLSKDGATDTITDFKLGQDTIDLSAYGLLHDVSDLQIISTPDGAELRFGDETLIIVTANGASLTAEDFTTADVINVSRVALDLVISDPPPDPDPDPEPGGTITGTSSADTLTGDGTAQTLLGKGGDDKLRGMGGADVLDGGNGFDWADYSTAAAGLTASLADPSENTGDAAGDSYVSIEGLIGSKHNDTLRGNSAANTLQGGNGSDILTGGGGADTLTGGNGQDFADYSTASVGLTVNLSNTSNNTGDAQGDTFNSIEGLIGSAFNDTLIGNSSNNTLRGAAGDDILRGRGGADVLDGGDGFDIADYDDATGGIIASLANSNLNTGVAAGDTYIDIEGLVGGKHADTLYGDAGANTLNGANGNDTLFGGGGADTFIGGGGTDTVDYSDAAQSITINVDFPTSNAGEALGDTFNSIENFRGTAFNDSITADNNNNQLFGLDGNDLIRGRGGEDRIEGGAGNDNLDGGDNNDTLYGGAGLDTLAGGNGNDFLFGETGDDSISGNAGNDTVDAGDGADKVFGGSGNDDLYGGNGVDFILGDAGDDIINGGIGGDRLMGGTGADAFVFDEFAPGTLELIIDYTDGEDTIHLKGPTSMREVFTLSLGNNLGLVYYQGSLIFMLGVDGNDLGAEDFVFF